MKPILLYYLTLFENEGEAKSFPSPASFFPLTYTSAGTSQKNLPTFSCNLFARFFSTSGVKFQGHTEWQSKIIELKPSSFFQKIDFSGQILIKLLL